MITITKVKIKGFRGFIKEQEFNFFSPVTILFGENGKGKSSLLNSIEWCLFGNDCVGKNTGIRERIDWEVKNRKANECYVELVIKEDNKECIVKRVWKSKTKDELTIKVSDGNLIKGEEAKKELVKLTKNFSFKDFLTSVYQHQEVIRFFLIQEPKDRNEAIDRLLGLSEYRNIIDGIKEAQIKGETLQNEVNNISEQIKAKIGVLKDLIDEKIKELNNKGIMDDEIREDGAINLAKNIKKLLSDFCAKINLNLTESFLRVDESDFDKFFDLTKKEITRLRSEMPDVKKENEIYEKIIEINKDLNDYKSAKDTFNEKNNILQEFIQKNEKIDELLNKKRDKEKEIKEKENEKDKISLLGAIIEKAISYLKSDIVTNKDICPVCGTEKEGLLEQLKKDYEEKYKRQLEEINKELETKNNELNKIKDLISEYESKEKDKTKSEEEFKKVSESIRSKWRIDVREDIEKWLENSKKNYENELEKIKNSVKEKQEELNKIEEKGENLLKIHEVLKLKEQMKKAMDIINSDEWKKLERKAEEFKKLAEKIENIVSAIRKASQEEAENKIKSSQKKINEYFKNITKHPFIKELKFERKEDPRTGGNSYEFRDQSEENIIPILSQGNLNALALSIFLALSESQDTPFNFLIFDDPSQSLGSSEKEEFSKILNEIAKQKNLIISTMDKEFYEIMGKYITKEKKIYEFKNWTSEEGPEIEVKEE